MCKYRNGKNHCIYCINLDRPSLECKIGGGDNCNFKNDETQEVVEKEEEVEV